MNTAMPIPSLDECVRAAAETETLLIKPEALGDIPSLLRGFSQGNSRHGGSGQGVFLVADENTYGVA
jgi:hypothetical protein